MQSGWAAAHSACVATGRQSRECYPGMLHVVCIPLFDFCVLHPKKGIGSS